MPAQIIGYNINGIEVGNEQRLMDVVRRMKSKTHLVMFGLHGLARRIYDTVGQTTGEEPIIVLREDWPDGDWNRDKWKTPSNYVNEFRGRGGFWNQAYIHFLNEPVPGRNNVNELLDRCMQFMDAIANKGLKGVVGNFADAAMFHRDWVDQGIFDNFLRYASQWTNAGYGYIGHHNYTYGSLAHGGGGKDPRDMISIAKVQPEFWATKEQMTVDGKGAEQNWLQMRFMWALHRCDKLGIPRYKFGITEGLWDDMPNLRTEGISPAIESNLLGGRKLRGPLDQRDLWKVWWNQWSPEQAGVKQIEWLVDCLPKECHFVHLFTWSTNGQWATYNFGAWNEFQEELIKYGERVFNGVEMPTYPDLPSAQDPRWKEVVHVAQVEVNMRKQPVVATSTLIENARLQPNELVHIVRDVVYNETINNVSYVWIAVKKNNIVGWVRQPPAIFAEPTENENEFTIQLVFRNAEEVNKFVETIEAISTQIREQVG